MVGFSLWDILSATVNLNYQCPPPHGHWATYMKIYMKVYYTTEVSDLERKLLYPSFCMTFVHSERFFLNNKLTAIDL